MGQDDFTNPNHSLAFGIRQERFFGLPHVLLGVDIQKNARAARSLRLVSYLESRMRGERKPGNGAIKGRPQAESGESGLCLCRALGLGVKRHEPIAARKRMLGHGQCVFEHVELEC